MPAVASSISAADIFGLLEYLQELFEALKALVEIIKQGKAEDCLKDLCPSTRPGSLLPLRKM